MRDGHRGRQSDCLFIETVAEAHTLPLLIGGKRKQLIQNPCVPPPTLDGTWFSFQRNLNKNKSTRESVWSFTSFMAEGANEMLFEASQSPIRWNGGFVHPWKLHRDHCEHLLEHLYETGGSLKNNSRRQFSIKSGLLLNLLQFPFSAVIPKFSYYSFSSMRC